MFAEIVSERHADRLKQELTEPSPAGAEAGATKSGAGGASGAEKQGAEPMDESAPLLELDGEPLAKPGGSGALVYKGKLAGVNDPCAVKFLATKGGRESNLEVLRAEVAICKTIVEHAHIVRFHHLSTCCAIGQRVHTPPPLAT